jgi:AcrR family transcriptional regulator
LWGRRERGKRGPRPGLSPDAIVGAAIALADAEGLESVSMARVAKELGFTPMSLYRYVGSKDELLALMFNASAQGAESVVLTGNGWRERLRDWALLQREYLDRHPWLTQMPLPGPPLAPNSAHFVEHALGAMDGTGLSPADKMRMVGLITSFTLSDAKMYHDARRAAAAARAGAGQIAGAEQAVDAERGEDARRPAEPWTYWGLLRELVDQATFPRLHELAWTEDPDRQPDDQAEFAFAIDRILDGIEAYIDRLGDRPTGE